MFRRRTVKAVGLAVLAGLALLVAGCGTQKATDSVGKRVMTASDSLDYFNVKDVGEVKPLPKGKLYLTAQDIRARGDLSTQSLQVLSTNPNEGYIEVGDWYIPSGVYQGLQETTPYNVSVEAMNVLEGSELQFLFNATPDEMRSELEKVGLSVRDVRELSVDGELSIDDLRTLASMADQRSAPARLAVMSGRSFRTILESRIAARQGRDVR